MSAPTLDHDAEALFVPDGDGWMPSGHARGPWDPGALHGGPVAALVTRALEAQPEALPLCRLTLELLRPVPFQRLTLRLVAARPGKRVQLDRAELYAEGELVASASGLRIREERLEVPASFDPPLAPGPEECETSKVTLGPDAAFHSTGVELRFPPERDLVAGSAHAWVRLRRPVIPGEEPTGFQRAAAAADFGNGLSSPLDYRTMTFINPDLNVMLFRQPEGEWIGMESDTSLGPLGRGLAESSLHDAAGRVGRSLQSLILRHR